MAMTPPIDRDAFNPRTAETDRQSYLWFTWLTPAQYNRFKVSGIVPAYKETRGDSVHKHHRIHNRPDHCINLAIHTSLSPGGMHQQTMTIMGRQFQSSSWSGRQASTISSRIHTTSAEHIPQYTSGAQRTFQSSSIQSTMDKTQFPSTSVSSWVLQLEFGGLASNRHIIVDKVVAGPQYLGLVRNRDIMTSQ
eukprot:4610368-Amphidinium_carterae.2